MGQFFEQGYGKATDDWEEEESALDIEKADSGLVMSGWIDEESKNMALWRIDDIGRLTQFGSYGHVGADQVGSALALHSSGGVMMVGRQTSNYEDAHHSYIEIEDQALIKCIGLDGVELWSLLLDSSYGETIDTHQVAVDVVNDGDDNFLILVNRMYGEGPTLDCRVVSMQFDGTVNWDETYTLDDHNIFAQKLIKSTDGKYTILANDVGGEYPVLLRFDESWGDFVTSASYNQTYSTTAYGIDYKTFGQASSGYVLAGVQDNGSDNDGFILEVANNLSAGTVQTITNTGDYPAGQELFREIATHPNGYVAIGECDNRGEGQRDVWICHLDTARDTLKLETLGGEETDYAQGVVMIPSMQSLFISGYNNSYTIEESGNAYLGGVKVDMPFGGEEECKVPRVLFVDNFVWHDGNGGVDLSNYILNNSTKEQALINFAKNNDINYLALFGANFIFDPNYYSGSLLARQKLSSFISSCRSNGIHCALVSTAVLSVFTNGLQYIVDIANNASNFGYNRSGKFSYFLLEHEFWNARWTKAYTGPTASIATFPISNTNTDVHFENVYENHKTMLTDLQNVNGLDANIAGVHDYVNFFYNDYSHSSNSHYHTQAAERKTRASEIESITDGIFIVYYQEYTSSQNGLDFLTTNATSGQRRYNVDRWKERLKDMGNLVGQTNVFPLFSAEFYEDSDEACGDGVGTDFLGKYLDGAKPFMGSGDLKSAESSYISAHTAAYNNNVDYPNLNKLNVSAIAWYKYSCLVGRTNYFNDLDRVNCTAFTGSPLNEEELLEVEIETFILFPNPAKELIYIKSNSTVEVNFKIYDLKGRLINRGTFNQLTSIRLEGLEEGVYNIQLSSKGKYTVKKVIVIND